MIVLGPLAAIAPDTAKGFEVDGHSFLLLRRGEVIYAYRNRCPHLGVELNWLPDQFLDHSGDFLQCATHGALFEPATGHCIAGPCRGKALEALGCRVVDGMVEVQLADMPA